ncbi:CRISPR-associated endonuclease Cas6 [Gaoshiqia sediminis]|uniref:CRISPR-associated endonuclease Cas6 n=1 Tax=Gaoshiqia sediminis TaxID=2986998 RepID=A0AA41YCW9_9BACT|nr:CRISPR-associated endonuclease Cas6 [Gaoshiqia sediminis]MCW0484165.1 CRISPR-associated endonuclease Cas6 [Gaoshiqia sediminis]
MQITQTTIQFPDIQLQTRDAHKLRGYFGNLFKEHSPLLHNHYADGSSRYAYPLVQYKVVDRIPALVGFQEGADLLVSLFLKICELNIEGQHFPVQAKNIQQKQIELSVNQQLYNYFFKTLWMALNQENFHKYSMLCDEDKKQFLNRQIQNNILSFYKGLGFRTTERIMAVARLEEKQTLFKNQTMLAFSGSFTSNAFLPDWAGIGKAVSRGFGTINLIE